MAPFLSEMNNLVAAKKQNLSRMMFALLLLIPAAILLFTAYILGTIALLHWLESQYPDLPAFFILCGGYAFLGSVVLVMARRQSSPAPDAKVSTTSQNTDSNNMTDAAVGAVHKMASKNLPTTLLITLVAGLAYGLSQQQKKD